MNLQIFKGSSGREVMAKLKQLSGQDSIRSEGKYKSIERFVYTGLVLMVSNHSLEIAEDDFCAQFRRYSPIFC